MDSIPQRQCPRCKTVKPLEGFYKGKLSLGTTSYCRECYKESLELRRRQRGVPLRADTKRRSGGQGSLGPRYDLAGQQKGTWTVISWQRKGRWLVRCSCGREKEIERGNWVAGRGLLRCPCTPREPNYNKLPPGESSFNSLFNNKYRDKSKRHGILFELTSEQFRILVTMNCAYCGVAPTQAAKTKTGSVFLYNGIDRIDAKKGYVWENCNPCCKHCNFAKSNMSLPDWLDHIKRIYNYMRLGDA